MGCLYIRLTGGEVFSHPDFDKVYGMLIKMGFVVTILTNGSLIKEKQIELLARYKPKRVEITLYSIIEQELNTLIYENLKEKTIIYVTHKLSTVMMADKIIFINNGMVDEIVTHDELIEKRGGYEKLWRHQTVYYE